MDTLRSASCYVSAVFHPKLALFIATLRTLGVRPYGAWDSGVNQSSLARVAVDGITRADAVIALWQMHAENTNVHFELGVATALGKPLMIVVPDLATPLPAIFADVLQVRAEVTNVEVIAAAVERTLAPRPDTQHAAADARGHAAPAGPLRRPTTQPIGLLADRLLAQLADAAGSEGRTAPLLDAVTIALEQAGLPMKPSSTPVAVPGGTRYALWIDELEASFGNPLLLEVREGSGAVNGTDTPVDALRASGVRTLLLLSGDAPEGGALTLVEPDRQVLQLRVADLIKGLRDHDLASALSVARLRAAGLDPAGG